MKKGALFSEDRTCRYSLSRTWDEEGPKALCIGLNPSTANGEDDDPTIRSLTRILTNANFGGFTMCNLFPVISPYPEKVSEWWSGQNEHLKLNDDIILITSSTSRVIICCWGNFSVAKIRARQIKLIAPYAMCFGHNANGSPKHPLYLKSDSKLMMFNWKIK